MDLYKLAAMHVKAIVDLLNQHGPTDKIVLAAYSDREEYDELHKAPGELSYDARFIWQCSLFYDWQTICQHQYGVCQPYKGGTSNKNASEQEIGACKSRNG